jgi:hypothetical protein
VLAVKIKDHGCRRGNAVQALAQWRRLVASSVVLDVLHQALQITLYCCITVAIETTNDLPEFFIVFDSVVITIAK